VTWREEGQILSVNNVSWATTKCRAPCIQKKGSTYYYYFCMNQSIGVAASTSPAGSFTDALGKPLIAQNAYGCQSIDPDVFIDTDGQAYLYFGQGACKVVTLNANITALEGEVKDITPSAYNEATHMIKRGGTYCLMWSENDTRDVNYQVAYATGTHPMGPFTKQGVILSRTGDFNGQGHHSILGNPDTDEWYVSYHRHYVPANPWDTDPTPSPTQSPEGPKGDVNSNGTVDIVDALLTAQYYVGLNPAGFVAAHADVNCSGAIGIVDALLIAQLYVGLIVSFPC
jgi:beta-xylosidase